MPVGQHVGLGDQGEHLLGVVAVAGELEGPADAALAAFAGVDGRLRGDLVRGVLLQEAADAAVHILGVLADDDEINVLGPLSFERRLDARKKLHRAEVDVLVELEAQLQQQALFEDARARRRDARPHPGTSRRRCELFDGPLGKDFAGFQIAVTAEVVMFELVLEVFELRDRGQDFQSFGGHFRAGTIATDHRDFQSLIADQGDILARH